MKELKLWTKESKKVGKGEATINRHPVIPMAKEEGCGHVYYTPLKCKVQGF